MKIIFWTSIFIIFYVYLGYPAFMFLVSLFYKRPVRRRYIYPNVSILISAYNEEKNIENKLRTLLDLDYPEDRLEILIGSDGSEDKTEEIISRYVNGTVRLYKQRRRLGKPSMLNALAKRAHGEILIFTDARQRLDKNSLKELVRNFYDKKVGSVSAELLFENEDNKTGNGIGLYWRYEKLIRISESKIESMLGATGAMYAIRKELFPELPRDLILDDVYIPLKTVQKGYRAIFEPKALIYDTVAKDAKEEFLRKTRTLTGNFQVFGYLKGLFNPFKSPVACQLFSHKFLRLIAPFLLIMVFVSNLFILHSHFYRLFFIMQIMFYAFAILGSIFKHKNRLFDIPHMFCVMNLAAVVGLYRFITNGQDILWQKARATLK